MIEAVLRQHLWMSIHFLNADKYHPFSVVFYASRSILETHRPFTTYERDSIARSPCRPIVAGRDPVYGTSVDDVHRSITAVPGEILLGSSMELTDRIGWGAQFHCGKKMGCNERHNVLTRLTCSQERIPLIIERNFIVLLIFQGPVAEEFIFRGCLVALVSHSGASLKTMVFGLPFVFGIGTFSSCSLQGDHKVEARSFFDHC